MTVMKNGSFLVADDGLRTAWLVAYTGTKKSHEVAARLALRLRYVPKVEIHVTCVLAAGARGLAARTH